MVICALLRNYIAVLRSVLGVRQIRPSVLTHKGPRTGDWPSLLEPPFLASDVGQIFLPYNVSELL